MKILLIGNKTIPEYQMAGILQESSIQAQILSCTQYDTVEEVVKKLSIDLVYAYADFPNDLPALKKLLRQLKAVNPNLYCMLRIYPHDFGEVDDSLQEVVDDFIGMPLESSEFAVRLRKAIQRVETQVRSREQNKLAAGLPQDEYQHGQATETIAKPDKNEEEDEKIELSKTQDHVLLNTTAAKDHIYLWLYVAAIALAEVVTAYRSPTQGIICHALLLAVLLVHASRTYEQDINRMYLALVLAPLIRITSLAMPLTGVPPIYRYLVISLPLFAAAYLVMRQAGYKLREVNITANMLPLQLLVALVGIPLGYVEYLILHPEPLAADMSLENIWLPALVLLVCTGFLEEFIFRGVMFRAALETIGGYYSVFYINIIFMLMHISHSSPLDLAFVFGVGLFFSLAVALSRSLLGVSIAHGLTNISLYLVWPFLLK